MSKRELLRNATWTAGPPEGVTVADRGPLIYQDRDGDIYALNPFDLIPDGIQRHCWLFEQGFRRRKAKMVQPNGNGAQGLSQAQRDALYREFETAYVNRYGLHEVSGRPYRSGRADFIQQAKLVQDRGIQWVLDNWSAAVEKYFDTDRWQGKHTLADLCSRIDVILAWEPKRRAPVLRIAEARGRSR